MATTSSPELSAAGQQVLAALPTYQRAGWRSTLLEIDRLPAAQQWDAHFRVLSASRLPNAKLSAGRERIHVRFGLSGASAPHVVAARRRRQDLETAGVWLVLCLGAVGVGVVLGLNGAGTGGDGGAGEYGATQACHQWVKDQLKSPSSAHFNGDSVDGDGPWTIHGTVDAENSFGASLRRGWVCTVSESGGSYTGEAVILE